MVQPPANLQVFWGRVVMGQLFWAVYIVSAGLQASIFLYSARNVECCVRSLVATDKRRSFIVSWLGLARAASGAKVASRICLCSWVVNTNHAHEFKSVVTR